MTASRPLHELVDAARAAKRDYPTRPPQVSVLQSEMKMLIDYEIASPTADPGIALGRLDLIGATFIMVEEGHEHRNEFAP